MRILVRLGVVALLSLTCLMAGCDGSPGSVGNETAGSLEQTGGKTGTERQTADAPSSPDAATEEPADENAPTLSERMQQSKEAVSETVASLSARADTWFKGLAKTPYRAWPVIVLTAGFGLLMMLYGWALVKSFMIPFAPVWGLVVGSFISFSLTRSFLAGESWTFWHRLGLIAVGTLFGVGLFMFAALKAKPVAALLVVVSPFLIVSAFVAATSTQMALVIFFIGFVLGCIAMVQVRNIAVISTSLFGALSLFAAYGVVAYLFLPPQGEQESSTVLVDSIRWLFDKPWMLLLVLAMLAFLGSNFQFATGPRGSLED